MTVVTADVPSNKRSTRFAGQGGRAAPPSAGAMAGLAAIPTVLAAAHLWFGANQPAAAAWLTVLLGLALLVTLSTSWRGFGLDDQLIAVPATLFALVLLAAVWSLTPWGPGGPHPVWIWAGVAPGALTVDVGATQLEIVKLLGLACAFALGTIQAGKRSNAQAAVEMIVWVGAIYAAISLIVFLSGYQIAPGRRLTGGFLSANSGGTVFGILTVLALTLLEREWRRGQGRDATRRMTMVAAPAAALTLAVVCLLLTASRMALLSTLIAVSALTLWVMLAGPKGRNSLAPGITLAITVAGILIVGGNDLLWSRLAQDDAMLDDRLLLFATHWEAFRISPLTGWGLGSFDVVNLHIMSSETAPSLWSIRAAHNVYIQWLEEAGLLGALPMFLLAAWLVLDAARRARQQGSGQSLLIGLVCANLVVLVHGTMDFALQVPSISAFWALLLGLQFGFGRSSSR